MSGATRRNAGSAVSEEPHSPTQAEIKSLQQKEPSRFKLIRTLVLADFITLSNAACGALSIFSCMNYLINPKEERYILAAFILLPLALMFDIADGTVARWRKAKSPYGKDLDSLADVISFAAGPAVMAFTLGCRGILDVVILTFFVCCGVGRLARFNVTAMALSANTGTGKVSHFAGTPVPTSLLLVALMAGLHYAGMMGPERILFGSYHPLLGALKIGSFHPFTLAFAVSGCLMISNIRIPKP